MKSRILWAASFVIIGVASVLIVKNQEVNSLFSDKELPQNPQKYYASPDYYKQYLEMKKNENGVIPTGLVSKWLKSDRALKKESDLVINVNEIGPNNVGGRVRAINVDPRDPNVLLAGGVSGGMWKSTNQGASWKSVNDGADNLTVTCVTHNPFNPDILYYGTGESVGNSAGIDGAGIFKSTDGGETWQQLEATNNASFSKIWMVKHSLTDSNTLYVGTNGAGAWYSKDGGETFTQMYTLASVNDIEVFEDSTLLLGASSRGILRGHESDLTQWESLNQGVPSFGSGIYRISLSYCESQPDNMYTIMVASDLRSLIGAYKSTDGGDSWSEMPTIKTAVSWNQAWYDLLLEVHPDNPNYLFTGGVQCAYSTNGGNSWTRANNTHSDYHSMAFLPNGDYIIGNDGGLYIYDKDKPTGTTTNLNNGFNVTQYYAGFYYPEGNESLVGGTQDNGTHYSNEGAAGFVRILGGDGSYCAVNQQDPDVIYVSTQYGKIRRMDFGGSTINIANKLGLSEDDVWFINPYEMNVVDGEQLYFPAKRHLYRTTNGGSSWDLLTDKALGNFYSIGMSKEENPLLYMGGSSSIVNYIENAATAGENEHNLIGNRPVLAVGSFVGNVEVDPKDPTTIYLAFTNYSTRPRIWRIDNANSDTAKWTAINGNLPDNLPVNWIEVDPVNTQNIVAATDFGLYATTTGGDIWDKIQGVPSTSIHQIRLRESDRKLYIFTHGRGVFTADLNSKYIGVEKLAQKAIVKVYPNPTTNWLTIETEGSINKFEIYGLDGKVYLEGQNPISNKVDVSKLSNGMYVLFVETKGGLVSKEKIWIK